MTGYEKQLDIASCENIMVIENYDMEGTRFKGLYCDEVIALSKDLQTQKERYCILSEELGHYYTTVGNILDQSDARNRKQEFRARLWAYNKNIGLQGIIRAYEARLTRFDEVAEFLEVTPEFLWDAVECYRSKYSPYVELDNYVIIFEPYLSVVKMV